MTKTFKLKPQVDHVNKLIKEESEKFNLNPDFIMHRDTKYVMARWGVIKRLYETGLYSSTSIAKALGLDHTSVIHAKQMGYVPKVVKKRMNKQ